MIPSEIKFLNRKKTYESLTNEIVAAKKEKNILKEPQHSRDNRPEIL